MGKFICVVSGKGGTGKTTATANIAISMAKLGHETLLIDTDLGLRNMDLALGLQDNVLYDVLDVCSGDCKTREAIILNDKYPNLSFLPASQFKEDNTISPSEMQIVADKVKDNFEYIFIDCPAGLGDIVKSVASVSDMALIVVNPDPFSLRDADRMAELISEYGVDKMNLIINRFKKQLVQNGQMFNLLQVIEKIAVPLIGAVPESDEILLSVINGVPYAAKNDNSFYTDIAKRITGEKIPITEIESKRRGFWRRKTKA